MTPDSGTVRNLKLEYERRRVEVAEKTLVMAERRLRYKEKALLWSAIIAWGGFFGAVLKWAPDVIQGITQ